MVPEDRSRPAGPSIRLAVAVFKAQHAGGAPPLLLLGGGPGSAVLNIHAPTISGSLAHDLTAGRDLIMFDQRGAGFSQPSLACQELIAEGRRFQHRLDDTAAVLAALRDYTSMHEG